MKLAFPKLIVNLNKYFFIFLPFPSFLPLKPCANKCCWPNGLFREGRLPSKGKTDIPISSVSIPKLSMAMSIFTEEEMGKPQWNLANNFQQSLDTQNVWFSANLHLLCSGFPSTLPILPPSIAQQITRLEKHIVIITYGYEK